MAEDKVSTGSFSVLWIVWMMLEIYMPQQIIGVAWLSSLGQTRAWLLRVRTWVFKSVIVDSTLTSHLVDHTRVLAAGSKCYASAGAEDPHHGGWASCSTAQRCTAPIYCCMLALYSSIFSALFHVFGETKQIDLLVVASFLFFVWSHISRDHRPYVLLTLTLPMGDWLVPYCSILCSELCYNTFEKMKIVFS